VLLQSGKKKVDERDQKRQLIDEQTEGTGRLRGGVDRARKGVEDARAGVERMRLAVERKRSAAEAKRSAAQSDAESKRSGEERRRFGVERMRAVVARKPSAGADGEERSGIGGRLDTDGAREAVEDAGWFLRRHVAWPVEDGLDRLGRRGAIGVFGGGGIALAGVVAALVIAGSGSSGSDAGTTEAFVTPQRAPQAPVPAVASPTTTPKPKVTKPTGPTLHGAPPDFAPAQDVRSGVGDGTAVGGSPSGSGPGGVAATRGATRGSSAAARGDGGGANDTGAADEAVTSANDTPASTAKIGATPGASAAAQARASKAATASDAGAASNAGAAGAGGRGATGAAGNAGTGSGTSAAGDASGTGTGTNGADDEAGANEGPTGPPAPKAAKRVARRFAEAFVVYEIGGTDGKVREAFGQTSTRQLSRSLLHRPPRQPASVKVPQAKVVNVVAGPSKGTVYTVSVSLLRVGVTSELRLEMERGVGKKWQVTNVLG
jgi:hypothetical protein